MSQNSPPTKKQINDLKDPDALGRWGLEASIESAIVLRSLIVNPTPGRSQDLARIRAAEKLVKVLKEFESYITSGDTVCPKCDFRFRVR